ncbi:MAG: hypothetical protein KAG96_07035 [Ichthyobacteriaceae bacterium]|nr:hypothetical protein [Ichthyobacteriaceae bacterium]
MKTLKLKINEKIYRNVITLLNRFKGIEIKESSDKKENTLINVEDNNSNNKQEETQEKTHKGNIRYSEHFDSEVDFSIKEEHLN